MLLGLEGRGKPVHFLLEFLGVVDPTDLRVPSIENARVCLGEVRQRPLFDTCTVADYRSKVVRERLRE
jgi:hypothetical protein